MNRTEPATTNSQELKNQLRRLFLHGDVNAACSTLLAWENRPAWADRLQQQLQQRFREQRPDRWSTKDPWIRQVLSSYATYFRDVLTGTLSADLATDALLRRLIPLSQVADSASLDQVESALQAELGQRGVFFQGGLTPPFYGPYVWQRTEERDYRVALPDGLSQSVRVYFLHDWLMRGWLHYASCGLFGAAGWAKPDGLYCIFPAYRSGLSSRQFTVSFLQHEAQHLNDYRSYAVLPNAVLEYRAKAVELIYRSDVRLLQRFAAQSSPDPTVPHAWAAYCLRRDLAWLLTGQRGAKPEDSSPAERKRAALECYRMSSRALQRALRQLAAGDACKLQALTDSTRWNELPATTRTAWTAEWIAMADNLLARGWQVSD